MTTSATMPAALRTAADGIFTAYLLAAADASAVSGQHDVDLKLVPTLPEDQALARSHAQQWTVDVAPRLLVASTDIAGYADQVAAFTPSLAATARAVEAGGPPDQLLGLVGHLHAAVADRVARLDATNQALAVLGEALHDDGVRFATLARTVPATYEPELGQLQSDIATLQATLAKDNETIAGAAVALLPGMVTVGFAAAAAVVVGTSAGKVIVQKGYTMLKGVVDDVDAALAEESTTIEAYGALLTELAEDKAELACFGSIAGYVTRFAGSTTRAADGVAALQQAWSSEDARLNVLAATAQEHQPVELEAMVDAAAPWWAEAGRRIDVQVRSVSVAPLS